MTRHTPGPWSYQKCTLGDPSNAHNPIVESDGQYIARLFAPMARAGCTSRSPTTQQEAEANAHLIAAAPDLLAALESLREVTDEPPPANCSCPLAPPCSDCVEYSGLREAIAMCDAAIAKAEPTP